ncbi:hypothetical protein [Streptomyces sp. NPDC049915]|uniref:hypothetical protein n=1 Tax=Streptomyces sp. NPDC049915 TaxID=3155510 RepID=UPI003412DC02
MNEAAETVTQAELAAFHQVVGKLRALPADDPVRLRAEQVAASFARDGRLRRRKARGERPPAPDRRSARGTGDRRPGARRLAGRAERQALARAANRARRAASFSSNFVASSFRPPM